MKSRALRPAAISPGHVCQRSSSAGRWAAWTSALLLLVSIVSCSSPERPNVILITVDTLRADRLGAYGSERGLTPNLDALAKDAVVFEWAFAPSSFTMASVAALLTGGYPEGVGVDSNYSVLSDQVPTLATRLRDAGYRTGGVVGNYVLRSEAGLARGFERYVDTMPEREANRDVPEATAVHVTRSALEIADALATGEQPLFLWAHYQDPHGPYTPPPGYRARHLDRERAEADGLNELKVARNLRDLRGIPAYQVIESEREVAFYRAGYDGEIEHVDAEIGRLLEALRERGLLERAVVVFSADHGESLGEGNYWFAHGAELTEALVRVPLFFRVPGRSPARRADVASLVDVIPTLGALLDLGVPDSLPGRDLLASTAQDESARVYMAALGGSAKPRFGVVVDGVHYVTRLVKPGQWHEQLTTLGGEALPGPRGEWLRRMRTELLAARESLPEPPERILREVPSAVRERLRALGYADP